MTRSLRAAIGLTCALLVTVAGCTGQHQHEQPEHDPDTIVLTPAKDGGTPHTHTKTVGDGTRPRAGGLRLADVRGPDGTGPGELSFRILDSDGTVLTRYDEEQTKLLHLYLVRADYQGFRHLHPTLSPDGTWRARTDLAEPGDYRLIAEFVPSTRKDGAHVVLGTSLSLAGGWQAQDVPSDRAGTDGVVSVQLPSSVGAGFEQTLDVTVSDGHRQVVNLGSYLGAWAHLTGFEVNTGAFVHAHPIGEPVATAAGSVLTFHTTFATPGRYRLFVQVRVDGFVHTIPVTLSVVSSA